MNYALRALKSQAFRRNRATDIFVGLLALWWVLLVIFSLFPQIDYEISAHFFVREVCGLGAHPNQNCGHFPYREDYYLQLLRAFCLWLPYVVAPILLWKLLECYGQYGTTFDARRARELKIALGSLIVGPILLVNGLLKEHWGRPRPLATLDFGGALDFVRAGSMAGKCASNCSFVSGEAAAAGWLLCLIILVRPPFRVAVFLPLAAISLLAPAMRLAFGAHYLSDVVLGWLSSLVIFAGLFALADSPQVEKKSEI